MDGELNSIQPGANKGDINPVRFQTALMQIYCYTHWTKANLAESMKVIERRREALKTFVSVKSGTSELHKTMEKAREIIDHSKAEIPKIMEDLEAKAKEQKARLSEIQNMTEKVVASNQEQQRFLDLHARIQDWQKSVVGP